MDRRLVEGKNHELMVFRFYRSMVRQYYGDDEADNPPVVQELPYDVERTFVDGFTVNTEAHGNAWKHFRITTTSEIIDVISAELPVISWSRPTHEAAAIED